MSEFIKILKERDKGIFKQAVIGFIVSMVFFVASVFFKVTKLHIFDNMVLCSNICLFLGFLPLFFSLIQIANLLFIKDH